ncbi:CheR family methyltransferase [Geothermobacter hydrogeniphilus]|uniref:protein-glutamate O-methyltransferase n=1 Tax=Geothermobacter hydrogeniphilus TaxID=1969733 RepID=A0A1X0YEM2_9BACT|nr:protein-glutamate O-methyltransferase CheR [Geothermobacter hydrogeniphilus]ORJ63533.1 chemotaxis protein CheR [Geothermobacter hydrogeniphilus]
MGWTQVSQAVASNGTAGHNHMMVISDDEFNAMRKLIYERFGINLTDQKRSLLVGRLQKLVRGNGFNSFQAYYQHLLNDSSERALSELVDRVSTNHTYFNRENDHFDYFRNTALPAVVERLKKENRLDLRIWCAGCSSGEEAYMLLMLIREVLGSDHRRWDAGILATDISDRVLAVARQGLYPEEKLSNMPAELKRKYFRQQPDGRWQVDESLRREATFRRFNLMNKTFPFKKPFQIIFCRNVMIYFDQPTRDTLVKKFHRLTEPDGYLFIGHSETLGRSQTLYRYLLPAAYQKMEV